MERAFWVSLSAPRSRALRDMRVLTRPVRRPFFPDWRPGVFGSPAWCSARRVLGSLWPRAGSARQGSPMNPGPCGFMPCRQCKRPFASPDEPRMRLYPSSRSAAFSTMALARLASAAPLRFLATLETTSPVNGGRKRELLPRPSPSHRSDACTPADVRTFQSFGRLRNLPCAYGRQYTRVSNRSNSFWPLYFVFKALARKIHGYACAVSALSAGRAAIAGPRGEVALHLAQASRRFAPSAGEGAGGPYIARLTLGRRRAGRRG